MRLVNYTSITRQDMKCSIEELVWINDVFYIQIDRKDKKGNWYWHTTFKIKDPRLPLKNICACIFAAKLFWALKGTFFSSTQDVILKILIWVVKKNRAKIDQMKITVLLAKILLAFISEGIYYNAKSFWQSFVTTGVLLRKTIKIFLNLTIYLWLQLIINLLKARQCTSSQVIT